jgi:hypothetical protein
LGEYHIVAATDDVIQDATRLLEQYPLRAYDAVHLRAAVLVNRHLLADGLDSLTFISADDRLNDAASDEGLSIDNPNRHP